MVSRNMKGVVFLIPNSNVYSLMKQNLNNIMIFNFCAVNWVEKINLILESSL